MCENLHYESVYFKELHNDQEYYWPTICRAGVAVASTITSSNTIRSLQSANGKKMSTNVKILDEAKNYYEHLYTSASVDVKDQI